MEVLAKQIAIQEIPSSQDNQKLLDTFDRVEAGGAVNFSKAEGAIKIAKAIGERRAGDEGLPIMLKMLINSGGMTVEDIAAMRVPELALRAKDAGYSVLVAQNVLTPGTEIKITDGYMFFGATANDSQGKEGYVFVDRKGVMFLRDGSPNNEKLSRRLVEITRELDQEKLSIVKVDRLVGPREWDDVELEDITHSADLERIIKQADQNSRENPWITVEDCLVYLRRNATRVESGFNSKPKPASEIEF